MSLKEGGIGARGVLGQWNSETGDPLQASEKS